MKENKGKKIRKWYTSCMKVFNYKEDQTKRLDQSMF